jgi:hypothetical protein
MMIVARREHVWSAIVGVGVLVAVAVGVEAARVSSAADDAPASWGAVRIPGGATALRKIAEAGDAPRARTTVLADAARAFFGTTVNGAPDRRQRVSEYLRYVVQLEQRLAAWPEGLPLSAATAPDRAQRDAFEDLVERLGLRLRTQQGRASVELDPDHEPVRRSWLTAIGIHPQRLLDQFNEGRVARVTIPSDEVPLPLPQWWTGTVFRGALEPVEQLVASPNHLLTYLGLIGLDGETLAWLAGHPETLQRVAEQRAPIFAGFGSALQIAGSVVQVPGGQDAVPIWESLVDASVSDPARFILNLLERHDGRLAYFYATVAAADLRRQAFLLGAAVKETRGGRDRLRHVASVRDYFVSVHPTWNAPLQPLLRLHLDPAMVVATVDVSADGVIGPDWWPSLLERVATSGAWPSRPRDTLNRLRSRPANAPWLLQFLFEQPVETEQRWMWVRYAQRLFASTPRDQAPDMEIALRGLKDMPALALALERLGENDPAVLAQVTRAARRLETSGDPESLVPAITRWQSALAIVEQIARHSPLPADARVKLLASLTAAIPARPLAASGTVANWFFHELLPTLETAAEIDETMEAAVLRGLLRADARLEDTFEWEGLSYRLDTRGPAAASAAALRAVMPGPRLHQLAILDRVARRLTKAPAALGDLEEMAKQIEAATVGTPSADLATVVRQLRRIRNVRDLARAVRERPRILAAIDRMTTEILPGMAYALALSPTQQPARIFADTPRLHELGSSEAVGRWESAAWQPGRVTRRSSGGASVRGALLGLDLARAGDLLTRASGVVGRPPAVGGAIHEITSRVLADRVVLRALPTVWNQTAAVAAAIRTGRTRAAALIAGESTAEDVQAELGRAGLSQWRRAQVAWLRGRGERDAAIALLTVTDYWRLGSEGGLPPGWGQSARPFDGCWCLGGVDRRPVDRFGGYTHGQTAASIPDLILRLAELLDELRLPGSLIEPALPMAVQDALDNADQFVSDDWEPLSRPSGLPIERLEDYLQVLVARRILAPPANQRLESR